jgi:hypothetical protein
LKIAEIGVTAGFLMIAKGFIPEMGAKSFAIMKSGRECEVSGIPGAGVTIRSAGMKALHDGRCPVRSELDRRLNGQAARPAHDFAFNTLRFPAGFDPRS